MLSLHSYCYETKGHPSAIVFFMPGYGDHCKNYGYFFEKLAKDDGVITYAVDRRGFGESQGIRGDVQSEDVAIKDYL